jgi:hypothetical protein
MAASTPTVPLSLHAVESQPSSISMIASLLPQRSGRRFSQAHRSSLPSSAVRQRVMNTSRQQLEPHTPHTLHLNEDGSVDLEELKRTCGGLRQPVTVKCPDCPTLHVIPIDHATRFTQEEPKYKIRKNYRSEMTDHRKCHRQNVASKEDDQDDTLSEDEADEAAAASTAPTTAPASVSRRPLPTLSASSTNRQQLVSRAAAASSSSSLPSSSAMQHTLPPASNGLHGNQLLSGMSAMSPLADPAVTTHELEPYSSAVLSSSTAAAVSQHSSTWLTPPVTLFGRGMSLGLKIAHGDQEVELRQFQTLYIGRDPMSNVYLPSL